MTFMTLNNGIEVPSIGLGVFRITDLDKCEEVVTQAIKAGYRLIDTAAAYGNEAAVGRAIKRADVKRSDLFISSKLWITDTSYEGAKKAFNATLQRLGLDYLDLYVIHQPYNDYYGAWRALSELYQAGKIRAIGVDNFSQAQLTDFIAFNQIKPTVNFIEVNPFYQRTDDIDWMRTVDIQPIAWSPFASGKFGIFNNAILQKIAAHHDKSVGQIVLRWLNQRGIIAVAKSEKVERIEQNINIFDFSLTTNEMQQIATLERGLEASLAGDRTKASVVAPFLEAAKSISFTEN